MIIFVLVSSKALARGYAACAYQFLDIYICGPERWIVDRGPIYTERLYGAAIKKTDKALFLVLLL